MFYSIFGKLGELIFFPAVTPSPILLLLSCLHWGLHSAGCPRGDVSPSEAVSNAVLNSYMG